MTTTTFLALPGSVNGHACAHRRLQLRFLALLLALQFNSVGLADSHNGLTDAEKRGGWQRLFDGKTTAGWRNYRQDGMSDGWTVKDGALSRVADGAGDIITVNQYKYFELAIEYRISRRGNSGIMFHVTEDQPAPWQSGPEVQVQDNVEGTDPQKAGWLYQLYRPLKPDWAREVEQQVGFSTPDVDDATRPAGEWNHVYLRVSRQQCEVAINGVSYYYFRMGDEEWNQRLAKSKFAKYDAFGTAGRGHICLQDHGDAVAYRNIKIRELPEDGSVPDPVDGQLPLAGQVAFPDLKWAGWDGVDEDGRIRPLRPIVLTHAGDGTNRVFVATQRGVIHTFENDQAAKESQIFLDITNAIHDWQKDNEEGLLGLAFHPKYASNGQFFVYYSSAQEPRTSIVSRFRVSKDDPSRADRDSEQVVMKIPQPFSNHNGGAITFGMDGYLYIALGDGGGRNDPKVLAQDLQSPMGCVLRIDVDREEGDRNYAVPPDNPFVNRPGAMPEIYAYGFRNIWRLSMDRKTGHLWAADVGQDLWEEINIVKAGGNYGWSAREASKNFSNQNREPQDAPIDPIWEYDHQVGKSITGGYVYRGSRLPELYGSYVYADFVSGKIWALKYDGKTGNVVQNMSIASKGIPVFSFGEDEQGEVYYLIEAVNGRGIYRFGRVE